jgi:hypothetical protein
MALKINYCEFLKKTSSLKNDTEVILHARDGIKDKLLRVFEKN